MKLQSISRMLATLDKHHVFVQAVYTDADIADELKVFNKNWLEALGDFASICNPKLLQGEYDDDANMKWSHTANKLLDNLGGLAFASQTMITKDIYNQPVSLDVRKKTTALLNKALMMFAKDHCDVAIEKYKEKVTRLTTSDIFALKHVTSYAKFIVKAYDIINSIVTEQLQIIINFQLHLEDD